jgi:hypothetical protein
MRILLARKVEKQGMKCGICGEPFTDCREIESRAEPRFGDVMCFDPSKTVRSRVNLCNANPRGDNFQLAYR